jgi:peptide/nickel transport system ATP-binding protein
MNILSINEISKTYLGEKPLFSSSAAYAVRALDNVSLSVGSGAIMGLVGESGSGKSTLGKLVCKYFEADSGTISLCGKPLKDYSRQELSHTVQMVFQDPYSSLNPRLNISTILTEAILEINRNERAAKMAAALVSVGLETSALKLYPHQFSGGQRQRIAIARALLKEPRLIIADEPLSSLDVTIQNQILELFKELRLKHNVSILFISHDIATTATLCENITVLKDGKIVESGLTNDIITKPLEEYTKKLIAAVPG